MLHFATLFDINYLSRGLALLSSLKAVCGSGSFTLYVLALDNHTVDYFKDNPLNDLIVVDLNELEHTFPELNLAKNNRSKVEYYFTLSPVWPLYILKKHPDIPRITTLDSDIYFYSSPASIFGHYDKNAVLITPHDFAPELSHLIQFGKYNVSFQSFPNTNTGHLILEDWKQKCLNWCKDSLDPETGNYADQKYLDDWSERFENVQSIDLKTCGRAPWNISNTKLSQSYTTLLVGDKPLIYYHFHHLRINGQYIGHGLQHYKLYKIEKPIQTIYAIYIRALRKKNQSLLLKNDNNIFRNTESTEQSILMYILRKEIGAIIIWNRIFYYNIINLKSKYRTLRKFLNGKFN